MTTEFLYDGDRLVAEYGANGVARRYVHGPGVDEPLLWYEGAATNVGHNWLIADRQGSIIATTDASGAATTYAYDAYGVPREWFAPGGAMLSRFRYTGQAALPELQLYHYKARVYDPGIGRFLQTDPVGYEDDLNLYQYTRNNPLNASDPSGMDIVCDDENPPNCRETIDIVITAERRGTTPLTQRQFNQITRQYSNQLAKDATVNYILPAVGTAALGAGVGIILREVAAAAVVASRLLTVDELLASSGSPILRQTGEFVYENIGSAGATFARLERTGEGVADTASSLRSIPLPGGGSATLRGSDIVIRTPGSPNTIVRFATP